MNSAVTGGVPAHRPTLSRLRHNNIPGRVIGGFLHGSVMFIDCGTLTRAVGKTKGIKQTRKKVHRAARSRHGREHSRGWTSGMPETGERKHL